MELLFKDTPKKEHLYKEGKAWWSLQDHVKEDNLSTTVKLAGPKVSVI